MGNPLPRVTLRMALVRLVRGYGGDNLERIVSYYDRGVPIIGCWLCGEQIGRPTMEIVYQGSPRIARLAIAYDKHVDAHIESIPEGKKDALRVIWSMHGSKANTPEEGVDIIGQVLDYADLRRPL